MFVVDASVALAWCFSDETTEGADRVLGLQAVELGAAVGEVLEAARAYDLTACDAAYLVLASQRGLALATVDKRLGAACERAGVELVL